MKETISHYVWSLEEIIALSYIKGLSYKKQREIILNNNPKYNSLYDYIDDNRKSDLFNDIHIDLNEIINNAREQIEKCAEHNINIITFWNEQYPDLLKNISYPPNLLYVKGKLQDSKAYSISVVGTRHCTSYGKLCTEYFVKYFSQNNIIVTSGLAYGIDSVAHKTCVKEKGITYAVIGCGIPQLQKNVKPLVDEIINNDGAIISEYRCGTAPLPQYFPQRNRIISGISKATLVVESASRGGALITAEFAADEGRDVFVVPGAITSEKSQGCNEWIAGKGNRKGLIAQCAISPEEMLKELGVIEIVANKRKQDISFQSNEEKLVYDSISFEPVNVDTLQARTKLGISELLVILLEMEFAGKIRQLPGKLYIREV